MDSVIDEIKQKLDIVEVIGSYIKLKKAGANYRAVCPFHSEKKPSFFVSPVRQIWHCFGCGKGGDAFGFVKEIEGVEFGDALRILAQRAGVQLKPMRPELRTQRQRLYEICELSCQFFEKQLIEGNIGKKVKDYLLARKIDENSQALWRVGYSPDTWHSLSNFLISKGYTREEIEKTGLGIKDEKGNFYDRFRGRIMFPIFDLNSQVVGFGGRVFESQKSKTENQAPDMVAKYINIPNTLLYDKSQILYGLNGARVDIRKKNGCVLVEGYIDVILSHQAGIKNVVSTSGTALTSYQLNILKRYSENLILAFDMDVGGDSATKRGIDLAQEAGFDIKVVILPQEKDPGDVISENPKDWEKAIEGTKSILDFYFENAFSKSDKTTPEGKKEISKILLPVLKRIPNKIVQSHWIQKLAKELKTGEENVLAELDKVKIETTEQMQSKKPDLEIRKKTRKELLEEKMIFTALKDQKALLLLEKEDFDFLSTNTVEILTSLKDIGLDFDKLKEKLSPDSFEILNLIFLETEIKDEEMEFKGEFEKCLNEIRCLMLKGELKNISDRIKEAEEKKDSKEIKLLTEKFSELVKKIKI